MTLWTNSYDRRNDQRSDRRYDPTGHLMTVKTTVDSTGGPIVRLILLISNDVPINMYPLTPNWYF